MFTALLAMFALGILAGAGATCWIHHGSFRRCYLAALAGLCRWADNRILAAQQPAAQQPAAQPKQP